MVLLVTVLLEVTHPSLELELRMLSGHSLVERKKLELLMGIEWMASLEVSFDDSLDDLMDVSLDALSEIICSNYCIETINS